MTEALDPLIDPLRLGGIYFELIEASQLLDSDPVEGERRFNALAHEMEVSGLTQADIDRIVSSAESNPLKRKMYTILFVDHTPSEGEPLGGYVKKILSQEGMGDIAERVGL